MELQLIIFLHFRNLQLKYLFFAGLEPFRLFELIGLNFIICYVFLVWALMSTFGFGVVLRQVSEEVLSLTGLKNNLYLFGLLRAPKHLGKNVFWNRIVYMNRMCLITKFARLNRSVLETSIMCFRQIL